MPLHLEDDGEVYICDHCAREFPDLEQAERHEASCDLVSAPAMPLTLEEKEETALAMQQLRLEALHAVESHEEVAYMPRPELYYSEQHLPHMSAAEKKRVTKERAGVAPGAKVGRKKLRAWMEADIELDIAP